MYVAFSRRGFIMDTTLNDMYVPVYDTSDLSIDNMLACELHEAVELLGTDKFYNVSACFDGKCAVQRRLHLHNTGLEFCCGVWSFNSNKLFISGNEVCVFMKGDENEDSAIVTIVLRVGTDEYNIAESEWGVIQEFRFMYVTPLSGNIFILRYLPEFRDADSLVILITDTGIPLGVFGLKGMYFYSLLDKKLLEPALPFLAKKVLLEGDIDDAWWNNRL